ncbi:two-component system QseEF-associated lipoprotein QseG [Xenorhabdus sp. Reich]|uniref:Two-component system QseEF-associated lipoprotein QseG n=1 Tax=Xenorhabdus littoralis TaxID=2582835 RepID=A0ABU4SP34_9GAMM|nr:two-component system QseEF-associated lipoprotein QseG [Xenorhabdus sp. Reich]MDX8000421.1 two-component system QseEF-associated lipoprotein QseG [Xenorhabdus sp. Reich]
MTKTEQHDIVTQPMKKSAVMQSILTRVSTLRFRAMLLLFVPYLLVGCAKTTGSDNLAIIAQSILPEQSITDYRLKECDLIWDITKPKAMENGLYWLRFIDCTDRLSLAEAREMAKQFTLTDWEQTFKQSILINKFTSALSERRKIVENLNRYSTQFPVSLRTLLQLWREQQYLKINLAEERNRFQRFQFDSDNKIDRLKETRARLEYELSSISRKLENLTDIERQLSSRKQNQSNVVTSGEAGHMNDTDTSSNKFKPEEKPSANTEAKPEVKPEAKPETKAEANSPEEKGAEEQ